MAAPKASSGSKSSKAKQSPKGSPKGSKIASTIKKLVFGGKSAAKTSTAKAAKTATTKKVDPKLAKTAAPAKKATEAAKSGKGAKAAVSAAKTANGKAAPAAAVLVKKPALTKAPRARKSEPMDAMARVMATRAALEASGETVCREVACEGLSTTGGYCRLHYIKNWKKIKRKEIILRERKLNQYIEELVLKYPDKYIDAIRQDLASDKDFAKVIYDLDLDENADDFDGEGEGMEGVIDNIKRDFDDDAGDF
jgi:hypothetical protein